MSLLEDLMLERESFIVECGCRDGEEMFRDYCKENGIAFEHNAGYGGDFRFVRGEYRGFQDPYGTYRGKIWHYAIQGFPFYAVSELIAEQDDLISANGLEELI